MSPRSQKKKTTIEWKASPNDENCEVFVNDEKACITVSTSCDVKSKIGPNAKVEIVAYGNDRTESDAKNAKFELEESIQVARLVGSTRNKTTLTAVDKRNLDLVVTLIKRQGFGEVVISQVTTRKSTLAASLQGIEAIKKYIIDNSGVEDLNFRTTEPSKKTYINLVSVGD